MIKEQYENLCNGTEVRANLLALKQEIRDENKKRAFAYLTGGDYSAIGALLKHEDAKVRKHAALVLGEMECEDMLPALWRAYCREEQLFVRSSYIRAMAQYDCSPYLPMLKDRRKELLGRTAAEDMAKHEREELAELRALLLQYEKEKRHSFTELSRATDVILLTNREHREITQEKLSQEKTALLAGGVRVRTKEIGRLLDIRTWMEMLFPIPGTELLPGQPKEAAEKLGTSRMLSFLRSCHDGDFPFYFRVEIRGKMTQEEKASFAKRFAAALEQASGKELINATTGYEIEVRLLQKKEGGFVPLLKLYTIKDRRFAYRRQSVASSIHPANAALVMELLKPYLKKGAQVLDPFCGVGTMLIERMHILGADPLYGIDIYPDAIEKARENAKAANMPIHYINRNCLDFCHAYLFDEIITNMPAVTRMKGVEEITELYERFFVKAKDLLKEAGLLAVYTTEEGILKDCLDKYDFWEVRKKWTIRQKEGSVLYVLLAK